ncbi:hypothetical protein ACJX0J_010815, partial [Zea mays]
MAMHFKTGCTTKEDNKVILLVDDNPKDEAYGAATKRNIRYYQWSNEYGEVFYALCIYVECYEPCIGTHVCIEFIDSCQELYKWDLLYGMLQPRLKLMPLILTSFLDILIHTTKYKEPNIILLNMQEFEV